MRKPDTRDKRTLARVLKKRRATPFQITAAAILLNAVGLPAALRFLKGPRRRLLRSAGDVRRYLTGHGITESVRIKRLGLRHKPLFVVCYADIDSVQAVRFAGCNGRARLRLSHSRRFKIEQLAHILSRTENVLAAGQVTDSRRNRRGRHR